LKVSAKQDAIELIGQLSDDVSLTDIIADLQEAHEIAEALRRYDERGGIPDEDLTEDEWRLFVAHGLRRELEDPREDIYSLDGGQSEVERSVTG
jgi:hypothetical protein